MAKNLPIPLPEPVIRTYSSFTDLRGKTPSGNKAFRLPETV